MTAGGWRGAPAQNKVTSPERRALQYWPLFAGAFLFQPRIRIAIIRTGIAPEGKAFWSQGVTALMPQAIPEKRGMHFLWRIRITGQKGLPRVAFDRYIEPGLERFHFEKVETL